MKAQRVQAIFQKTIADSVISIAGSYDALIEEGSSGFGDMLRLTDPRDEEFKRIGIDDATIVLIPIPILFQLPHLRMPCGHLVPHPGLGGQVVNCRCGQVWRVQTKNGETSVHQHGDWKRHVDTAGGDQRDLGGAVPAPEVAEEKPAEGSDPGGPGSNGSDTERHYGDPIR